MGKRNFNRKFIKKKVPDSDTDSVASSLDLEAEIDKFNDEIEKRNGVFEVEPEEAVGTSESEEVVEETPEPSQKKKAKKRKRKNSQPSEEPKPKLPAPVRHSDDPPPVKSKWINRQRALVFSARGITSRDRHFLKDLRSLMPHSKEENKMERRQHLLEINNLATQKNCNKAVFFEARKKKDLYMWVSNVPDGPSAKFLVENVHTMGELKLTGNCLRGSRPILSFDDNFNTHPHYSVLKELFMQVFGVPNQHPKSQPFFDKVITFTVMDNRIWYRQYQIIKEDGALAEIGPRFVLNPIKIFEESFGGATLWMNPHYVTPNAYRRQLKQVAGNKYVQRVEHKKERLRTEPKTSYKTLPNDELFSGEPYEVAARIVGQQLPPAEKQKLPQISFKKKKRAGNKFKKKPPTA